MLTLSPNFAYLAFTLGVFVLVMTPLYLWSPETRKQQRFLALGGAIGGLLMGNVYSSFWNPGSILPQSAWFSLRLEDALFGAGFINVTMLPQLMAGQRLEPEAKKTVSRGAKVWTLFSVVAVSAFGWILDPKDPVTATSFGLLFGVFVMMMYHKDSTLSWMALIGGVVTMLAYAALLDLFMRLVGNEAELARAFCEGRSCAQAAYVGHAPLILWMWALAFGAFFTPFYAFLTNQRYVSRA